MTKFSAQILMHMHVLIAPCTINMPMTVYTNAIHANTRAIPHAHTNVRAQFRTQTLMHARSSAYMQSVAHLKIEEGLGDDKSASKIDESRDGRSGNFDVRGKHFRHQQPTNRTETEGKEH